MGTTSTFFGGSGGGSTLPDPIFLYNKSSSTYTFPYDGTVLVHVIGAGGSGGKQYSNYMCTGGGAGGYSRKEFSVSSGNTATVTTGVGGREAGFQLSDAEGIAGTASSFVFGGSTLTANGGGAGQRYSQNGGAGGTASGGDVNYTGGRGGNIGGTYNNNKRQTTGGGAVNFFNIDTNGGDIADLDPSFVATGGGGIGGNGGGLSGNVLGTWYATGGGGTGGPAYYRDVNTILNYGGLQGGGGGCTLFGKFWIGTGQQGIQKYNMNQYQSTDESPAHNLAEIPFGCGGGGMLLLDGTDEGGFEMSVAGMFGGGGALVSQPNRNHKHAGSALIGGGGGAFTTSNNQTNSTSVSGRGGQGCVVIEYTAI